MQTPTINKLEIQDTPIKTLRIEWRESDTDYNADLPISWMLVQFGFKAVTDKDVRGASRSKFFAAAAKKYAHVLIAKAKEDFPNMINSLTCDSAAPIPEHFQIRRA